jgi:hypothetical protein
LNGPSRTSTPGSWWASPRALGIGERARLYAVLFIVGAAGYLGWIALPLASPTLSHPLVLAASGFMCLVEFFADKVPGVDSLWTSCTR